MKLCLGHDQKYNAGISYLLDYDIRPKVIRYYLRINEKHR